jgi:fluoroacetyl-CoA thioesterase
VISSLDACRPNARPPYLAIGLLQCGERFRSLLIERKQFYARLGGDGVLSTPSMIALMERASIQAVQDYLPEGHTTVGFEGSRQAFRSHPKRASLIEVDWRKLHSRSKPRDEDKKVGDGTIGA